MIGRTCIVIPCYNEADRFKTQEYLTFLEKVPDIDFCFVNDGSKDNTAEVLENIRKELPDRVIVVDYSDNRGKAEAVRTGFQHVLAQGSYRAVAFADADLATPLKEMKRLIDIFGTEPGALVVMGSRIERMGVVINRKLYRHFTGRIFAGIIAVLFRLNAYDTQCGAKVFDSEIAKIVFQDPFISRWLFDVEMLLRIRNLRSDYNRIIYEVPLNIWLEQGNSKIRFSHLLKMPFQIGKIWFKYQK